MSKKRALFIKKSDTNSKFILNDLDILNEHYLTTLKNVKISNNLFIFAILLKEFFYLLFNIWKYRIVYIWFADYHSFFPILFCRLLGIKSVISAGGYESTYIPEINTGVYVGRTLPQRIRMFCVKFSLNNCSVILTVDETLIENVNDYIYSDIPGKKPLQDGIKHFIPSLKSKIKPLYLGFDPGIFRRNENIKKEYSVVTAGLIVNDNEYRRKGIDLLIEAAKIMPDVRFIFIGLNDEYIDYFQKLNLKNAVLNKKVEYDELISEYSKAKVFAQISMFEGMPSAICEAMLCECIPVGSNVNGIPKVIGNCGYIVKNRNVNEIVQKLYEALNSPEELGIEARKHIISNFSLEKRKDLLLKTLEEI
ncbi:MAG: glycosyltransferase family 4 protein [Ignavibacteria bacterium]